ncbi:hypothetical protein EI545_05330 [Tabrizicola piscis]|uniref:Uncharacterized protein n=2 Tax=Tabrizicola piscis TaxID=2494374 RepID=A0A3S8U426_9RHOB|nr:hypothetical protein EI545_05330 [Tabrizicola piscis]
MSLPPRVYFTLHEASARWGCNIADIAGWADAGRFRILTGITAVRCGDEVIAGKVTLSPMELMPLFRRCGTGPSEGIMRRIQPAGRQDWLLITDPVCGITVAVADMVIMAEEVHAFEDENDMIRRVAAGPGVSTSYDWEGMNIALIVRIFDRGLPETQADLVAEMQEWFADRSDGKKMPDSRSIRRRITPIWRALQRGDA